MRINFNKTVLIKSLLAIIVIGVALVLWKELYSKTPKAQPAAQIAIVNLSRIRNEALAFVKFKELIERQYKTFHTEIISTQNALRQKYQQVKDLEKVSKKSGAELQKRKEELDHSVADLDRQVRNRKEKLSENFESISTEIENTIRAIINDIAHNKKLNLIFNATILDASVVLYSGEELDITDEVLQELNKQLPTVHLPS